jgi:hypothetical protein
MIVRNYSQVPLKDRLYRVYAACHNDSRERYIGESMKMADVSICSWHIQLHSFTLGHQQLATDEFNAIAMIQKMISSFADSQRYLNLSLMCSVNILSQ